MFLSSKKFSVVIVLLIFSVRSLALAESTRLAAVGDILMHEALQKYAVNNKDGYDSILKLTKTYLESADFAIGNLEGPTAAGVLKDGTEVPDPGFVYDGKVYNGTDFVFNYHPVLVTTLRKMGFDLVSTANNHALDRRGLGIDKTISNLEANSMLFTGTHKADEPKTWAFTRVQIKEMNFSFLACTEHLNGKKDPNGQVLMCYKDQKIILDLVKKESQLSTAVILLPHWGVEYNHQPNSSQKSWARQMISEGATAIIGNHPHVLQTLEWIPGKNGAKGFVAYSLGNFIAWQASVPKKTSAILYLDFQMKNGRPQVAQVSWTPLFRTGYQVSPYTSRMGKEPQELINNLWGTQPLKP
jgi:poly-gamma-glutamate synthesis protein (capsule biosynthesis protein)